MKKLWLLGILVGFGPASVSAQTTEELVNDGKNTENVTTQSMGFHRRNYSPLAEVNRSTAGGSCPSGARA